MKFGGSSVADAQRIRLVLGIVRAAAQDDRTVVVFSAMKGVTDQLLDAATLAAAGQTGHSADVSAIRERHLRTASELIEDAALAAVTCESIEKLCAELGELLHGVHLVHECTPRTRDLIVSHGEQLNCTVIAAAMAAAGTPARYVDARTIIRTDNTHGSAVVDFGVTYSRVREELAHERAVAVVTGFIASDPEGVTTTLGRNGSDYTASLLGAALDADRIEIWTDVDGVYSADPRFVPRSFVLPEISYREAMELSYFGAEVIHPYTMVPAVEKGIPLFIRNTLNPQAPGTRITDHVSGHAGPITGIASIESVALVNVEGGGMVGLQGIAGRIFSTLASARINIIMISQASSEHSICFIVRDEQAAAATRALERELDRELERKQIERVQVERDLEIVAVIGENMRGRPGISGRLFSALGASGVNVLAIAQGSSEMNISFVVHRGDREATLTAVHDAFFQRSGS
jgi:aspartokinase/homoserine dehydrogenase 1